MEPLFRNEVVEAHRPQWLGSIRLAVPVSHRIWGTVALLFTAALVTWLFLGHYTRRQHVSGRLVPDAGLLHITAQAAGTVGTLDVAEGSTVHANQPLATLVSDRNSESMGATAAVVAAKLRAHEHGLRASLKDIRTQAKSQAASLRRHIASLGTQIRETSAQLDLRGQQAATAEALVERITPLHVRGIVSTVEFDQYQADALADRAQLETLRRQQESLKQQQGALRATQAQLPLETAKQVHQLQGQLAELDASLAKNALERGSVLRAPKAGIVSAVLVHPGEAVEPGESLVNVLPQGASLQAQLLVPSSAVGFVHKGTQVVLHYQAFPYQKFGVQHGTVVKVSHSALDASELASLLGQTPPSHALYRVTVHLERQSVQAYGKPHRLLPGMALQADLLLDHRRLIDWIFEPLYGMAKRSGGNA